MQGTHKGLPAEGSGNGTCLHKSKPPGCEPRGMEPSWSTHSHGVGAAGQWEVCCSFRVLAPLKRDAKYTLLLNCEIQDIIALWHIFRRSLLPVDLLLILIVMTSLNCAHAHVGLKQAKGLLRFPE